MERSYSVPVLDEWQCVDMECSHYDGDMCTLGGCYDPDPNPDWLAEQQRLEWGDIQGDLQRESGEW